MNFERSDSWIHTRAASAHREALVVGAPMVARYETLTSLAPAPVDHPLGVGQFIRTDPTGQTDVPGRVGGWQRH